MLATFQLPFRLCHCRSNEFLNVIYSSINIRRLLHTSIDFIDEMILYNKARILECVRFFPFHSRRLGEKNFLLRYSPFSKGERESNSWKSYFKIFLPDYRTSKYRFQVPIFRTNCILAFPIFREIY